MSNTILKHVKGLIHTIMEKNCRMYSSFLMLNNFVTNISILCNIRCQFSYTCILDTWLRLSCQIFRADDTLMGKTLALKIFKKMCFILLIIYLDIQYSQYTFISWYIYIDTLSKYLYIDMCIHKYPLLTM